MFVSDGLGLLHKKGSKRTRKRRHVGRRWGRHDKKEKKAHFSPHHPRTITSLLQFPHVAYDSFTLYVLLILFASFRMCSKLKPVMTSLVESSAPPTDTAYLMM